MADYDVIVIGTGCGGLSVGSILAKGGRKVLMLEQSNQVGGCCSTFTKDGFTFDIGASIIEDAEVIDWCFQKLGTSLRTEVDLIAPDPTYNVIMKDGTRMKYPVSIEECAKEIAKIAPEDVKGWYNFCRDMKDFMNAALSGFFIKPANTFSDVMKMFTDTPTLLKYSSLFSSSYQSTIYKYFKNEKIRESLAFQCFYAGLPPELLPGIYAMIPYSEHEGIYYSKGGMSGIPSALARIGKKHGMQIMLNTLVKKIIIRNKQAVGVMLSDGKEITANIVISDINSKKMYIEMVGEENLPSSVIKGVNSLIYSMATPTIYLGVDYKPPLEGHHTLVTLPMEEMNDYWWNYYKAGKYPVEQFGIISWTTGSDPNLAPEGNHVIMLTLAPGPYKLAESNWDDQKKFLMDKIIAYYSQRYVPGLADHIKVAEFSTPVDFERRLLSPEGAIYALQQDVTHAISFRPAAKSKSINKLYLVGASTHPGGGVPTVIASGMIAADLIDKYEK